MAADYVMKRNDTYPPLKVQLTDSNGAIDLSQATAVKLVLKGQASSTIVTGTCQILSPASQGNVQYSWIARDTAVADIYQMEFEITWPGGGVQTVPNAQASNKLLEIDPDLENA